MPKEKVKLELQYGLGSVYRNTMLRNRKDYQEQNTQF